MTDQPLETESPEKQIVNWLNQQPTWFRVAARAYCAGESITDQLVVSWLRFAMRPQSSELFSEVDLAPLIESPSATKYVLRRIGNIKGVNRLQGHLALDLPGDNLVIIYGNNASGKSGYTRLLKTISGKMPLTKLHNNVFAKASAHKSCDITIVDSGEQILPWNQDSGPVQDLRTLQIFDHAVARRYRSDEKPLDYELPVLKLFDYVVDACTRVSARIDLEKSRRPRALPIMPGEFQQTRAHSFLLAVSSRTTDSQIGAATRWSEQDDSELSDAIALISNMADAKYIQQLGARLLLAKNLRTKIQALTGHYVQSTLDSLAAARKGIRELEAAHRSTGQAAKEAAALPGFGSESWAALWDAARSYSKELEHQTFPPVEGETCPLCQQTINGAATKRLRSFDTYVREEVATRLSQAKKSLADQIEGLPSLPESDLTSQLKTLSSKPEDVETLVETFLQTLALFRSLALDDQLEVNTVPGIECYAKVALLIDEALVRLEKENTAVTSGDIVVKRIAATKDLKELQARKWLSENRDSIPAEVKRLKAIEALDRARQSTDTTELSIFKGELVKTVQTAEVEALFLTELNGFRRYRPPVSFSYSRTAKGKSLHRLSFSKKANAAVLDEVLSEGEQQIVSLAAFLADSATSKSLSPFIFDDPVSSLDHVYEENVAKRLVELSKDRQVIVFTHRLGFASLLQLHADRLKCTQESLAVAHSESETGIPMRFPFQGQKIEPRLNHLLNERVPQIKKHEAAGEMDEAQVKVGDLCKGIRQMLEAVVEQVLCNGVVRRFSREIQTKGKLAGLSKVTLQDCARIDDLMTRYSVDLHDQPEESPYVLPPLSEIEADLQDLKVWLAEFNARPA
jgi:ABC-type hemin transport system ATPase subunit